MSQKNLNILKIHFIDAVYWEKEYSVFFRHWLLFITFMFERVNSIFFMNMYDIIGIIMFNGIQCIVKLQNIFKMKNTLFILFNCTIVINYYVYKIIIINKQKSSCRVLIPS